MKGTKALRHCGTKFFTVLLFAPLRAARALNDVAICAPLEGEPKSLISKGGKNVLNYQNEPSPEFVSSPQLTNKFYPQLTHTDSHVSPQLNGSLCITEREGKEKHNDLSA